MLYQALLLAASAALASAQITYNGSQIICPADNPNGNFCAGNSLGTNIIIRCVNGVAGPGNCNDNLDGEPPFGDNPTLCWQTSLTSGDAACSKNCVVYGTNGTFTLPASLCTPYYTATSSSTTAPSTSSYPTSPTTTSSSYTTSTGTTTCTTGSTTTTQTFTTTYCPSSSIIPPPNNGTVSTSSSSGSPTNTPSGPSSTVSAFTGAATAFHPAIGGTLAGVGLVVAYFL